MRVLVTGAAGSIGRVVTTGLAAAGHDVVGLDLVPPPDGTPFAWHEADGRLSPSALDMRLAYKKRNPR